MDKLISFSLDGQQVTASPDETIWQIAKRLGHTIPHLCFNDKPNYRPDGNCRTCMVEIEPPRAAENQTMAWSSIRKANAPLV